MRTGGIGTGTRDNEGCERLGGMAMPRLRIPDWLTDSACCFSWSPLNVQRWARASIIIHVTGHPSGLWYCRCDRVRKQAMFPLVCPIFLIMGCLQLNLDQRQGPLP